MPAFNGRLKLWQLLLLINICSFQAFAQANCGECTMTVVESIPEGLTFNGSVNHLSTFDGWKHLISLAKEKIQIGSYYWTLQDQEYPHPTADQGKEIFRLLKEAGTKPEITIQIAQELDSDSFPNLDTAQLVEAGAAEVRKLNFTRLVQAGILHTKMWVVDRKHIYIGSANFDWRAMTQVKELGVIGTNCACLGEDLGKAFDVYWKLGEENATIPETWGPEYAVEHGKEDPMLISVNGTEYFSYISSSPPAFCPEGRTTDLESIFDVIDNAEEFIHIAVMDYFPLILFSYPNTYWADIDTRLRSAAIDRKIRIRLLMAKWDTTRESSFGFLKSLENMNGTYHGVDVQVRMFEVPSTLDQANIPFARVNHNKYMVSDKSAYIGTSNWSGDYFLSTAGIGLVVTPRAENPSIPNIHSQLVDIFQRDWNSAYSKTLDSFKDPKPETECPATETPTPTSSTTESTASSQVGGRIPTLIAILAMSVCRLSLLVVYSAQ